MPDTIYVAHKKFHHHFIPHRHRLDEPQQRAHLISVTALLVYLQLIAVFAFGFYIVGVAKPDVLGTATFGSGEIIKLTNHERNQNGLPDLAENKQLEQAAKAKAADMITFDYWAHYSPQGKSPWDFINSAGYKYTYAGENLARDFDDANSVVVAWMNSPSHRSNMLDENFREIGVAVADGKLGGREGILVVQEFGTNPSSPVAEKVNGQRQSQSESQSKQVAGESNVNPANLLGTKFGMAKYVSLGLLGFIFLLFVLEIITSLKFAHLKVQTSVFAHLLVLGFILAALWYSTAGAIK